MTENVTPDRFFVGCCKCRHGARISLYVIRDKNRDVEFFSESNQTCQMLLRDYVNFESLIRLTTHLIQFLLALRKFPSAAVIGSE